MKLSFRKYQGSGNDFILIDDRSSLFPVDDPKTVQLLCSHIWGIGADGLILLQSSDKCSFRFRIFNSDGFEADLCGNGLRCFTRYLKDLGCAETEFQIDTARGILTSSFEGDRVRVEMPTPQILHWAIELENLPLDEVFVIDTGVPHAVIFVENLDEYPVEAAGCLIRNHKLFFPKGVNVNFVEISADKTLYIRTYERGIEAETLACGTGSAASAFVAFKKKYLNSSIRVIPKSKETIDFIIKETSQGIELSMIGSAAFVFEGFIEIQVPVKQT